MKTNEKAPRATIETSEVIKIVVEATLSCYGVVGIMDKKMVSHLDVIKKGKKEEAIFVKRGIGNTFSIDVYLILANDVKITETLSSAQEVILYNLNKKFAKACTAVNVFSGMLASK